MKPDTTETVIAAAVVFVASLAELNLAGDGSEADVIIEQARKLRDRIAKVVVA